MKKTSEPRIYADISEIEFDEMWHFLQKNSKTLDHQGRESSQPANYWLGYRGGVYSNIQTTLWNRQAYKKIGDFTRIIKSRHIIEKSAAACIERDNSNTRHHLGTNGPSHKSCLQKRIYAHNGSAQWLPQDLVRSYNTRKLPAISKHTTLYL